VHAATGGVSCTAVPRKPDPKPLEQADGDVRKDVMNLLETFFSTSRTKVVL
jgi:hypothetical protein